MILNMKTIHQSISILNHIMNNILGGISRPPNMASLWHYSLIIDLFCRRSFSVFPDLHFEEIRLVEALVDVSEFSEELNRLVPNILVLLVHEKQLGLKSGTFPYWQDNEFYKSHRVFFLHPPDDWLFMDLMMMVVGQQNLFGVDQLGLAVQQGVLEEENKAQKKMRAGVPWCLFAMLWEPGWGRRWRGRGRMFQQFSSSSVGNHISPVWQYHIYHIYITYISHISHVYHMYGSNHIYPISEYHFTPFGQNAHFFAFPSKPASRKF